MFCEHECEASHTQTHDIFDMALIYGDGFETIGSVIQSKLTTHKLKYLHINSD